MTALYRRLLGASFDRLPAQVRALHDLSGEATWVGRADVSRGNSSAVQLLASLLRLPPAGPDQPLSVTFTPRGATEVWRRRFGSSDFVSLQSADGAILIEQVGPVTLRMALAADERSLTLDLVGVRCLGVPLPGFLIPRIETCEDEDGGRYRFRVAATLPGFGLLVRYEGVLEPATPR